jgi:hypothetical protein
MRTTPFLLAAAALASACSPEPAATNAPDAAEPGPTPAAVVEPVTPVTPSPSPSPSTTPAASLTEELEETAEPGPGGGPIALGALKPDEGAGLKGELRCSFARQGRTLLLAAADVDPKGRAVAAVRNGDYPEQLVGLTEGGFNALTRGGRFGGKGLTAALTRGAREATGGEETRHRATLKLDRADGAVRVYRGTWTCGP